jgi:Fe(3+) dicitrate transport protein
VAVNYVGKTRTSAGQGVMDIDQQVSGRVVTDLSIQYTHNDNLRFFANVDNVFDKAYMVSRRPYGVRPGKPQSFSLGVHLTY